MLLVLILPLHLVWGEVLGTSMAAPAFTGVHAHHEPAGSDEPAVSSAAVDLFELFEPCHTSCHTGLEATAYASFQLLNAQGRLAELAPLSYLPPHLPGPDKPNWPALLVS
ncbi:hypothetical protein [Jeongeupia sp. USM3]|uniref:hypothetical protein n=1 Tax=Jeongeupia sp. USM3 TaxID=1906741 RepID=UPI0011AB5859|nr:hypothetical protein [Jeongeupia sp. USM3]